MQIYTIVYILLQKPTSNLIDDTSEFNSHSSMKTLTTHFIDTEFVTKGLTMKNFE